MNRTQALAYVGHAIDDTLCPRRIQDAPANAHLVGWQCGFEPMFVAVWSYLPGCTLDPDEAEEVATDYLCEIGWFAEVRPADYVI